MGEKVPFVAWGKVDKKPPAPKTVATPKPAPTPTGSREPVPPGATPEMGVTAKPGYTPWPNRFWDAVTPTLEPLDAIVLGQLVRLTLGHKRETCQIGMKRLAERANAGVNTVRRAVHRLERRGLVVRVETVSSEGPNDERGVVWAVRLPSPETGAAPAKRVTAGTGGAPDSVAMKGSSETSHENPGMKRRALEHEFRQRNPRATDDEIALAVGEAIAGMT